MKTIKLLLVAIIATIASSCTKTDEPTNAKNIINKIEGTTWVANVENAWITSKGTYNFNFQKDSNICTLQFIPTVKMYDGVKNEEKTVTGTYALDDGLGDRGDYILPDNDSNPFTNDMIFKRGEKTRIHTEEYLNINGVMTTYLVVADGVLINNGSQFQTKFELVKN